VGADCRKMHTWVPRGLPWTRGPRRVTVVAATTPWETASRLAMQLLAHGHLGPSEIELVASDTSGAQEAESRQRVAASRVARRFAQEAVQGLQFDRSTPPSGLRSPPQTAWRKRAFEPCPVVTLDEVLLRQVSGPDPRAVRLVASADAAALEAALQGHGREVSALAARAAQLVIVAPPDEAARLAEAVDVPVRTGAPSALTVFTGPMFAGKSLSLLTHVRFAVAHPEEATSSAPHACSEGGHATKGPPFHSAVPLCEDSILPAHSCVRLLKPALDTRSAEGTVQCHNGALVRGVHTVQSLDEVQDITPGTLVAVDEAHFFGDDLVRLWHRVRAVPGAGLSLAGLNLDFMRREFGPTLRLAREAGAEVHHLSSACRATPGCENPAPYSLRRDASDTEVVRVGGSETYVSACHDCYEQHTASQ